MSAPVSAIGPEGKLPDISHAPEADQYNLWVDFYKLRIQEYGERYESMRKLEWKVLFQVYAGYAAIALVYKYIQNDEKELDHRLISWLALTGTMIFYAASRYLAYRIQERMMRFERTRDTYFKEMESAYHIHKASPGTDGLGHQFYWTYRVQLVLSTLVLAGLTAYELAKGSGVPPRAVLLFIILIFSACLILGWHKVPLTEKLAEPGATADSKKKQTAVAADSGQQR